MIFPARIKIIIFFFKPYLLWGPTFYARKLGTGESSELKEHDSEANQSAPSTVEFKNEWIFRPTRQSVRSFVFMDIAAMTQTLSLFLNNTVYLNMPQSNILLCQML